MKLARSTFLMFAGVAVFAAGTVAGRPVDAVHATAGTDYVRAVADTHRSAENRALDEGRKPDEVLAFARIHKGETVADFGAGGGYYSELLADLVGPKGRVIALTTPKYFKADVWEKLRIGHANIGLIVSDNTDLAPHSVDLIFSHLVFHDLFLSGRNPGPVLANWFAAVKPGGAVIIADHRGSAGDTISIADSLHRIAPEAVTAAMIAAGFVADGSSDALSRRDDALNLNVFDPKVRGKTDRFLLRFRRP